MAPKKATAKSRQMSKIKAPRIAKDNPRTVTDGRTRPTEDSPSPSPEYEEEEAEEFIENPGPVSLAQFR